MKKLNDIAKHAEMLVNKKHSPKLPKKDAAEEAAEGAKGHNAAEEAAEMPKSKKPNPFKKKGA